MLANVEQSIFVSWGDMANIDLSQCEVIWWHWQHQPSENISDFESGATSTAMAYRTKLQDYYKNGGDEEDKITAREAEKVYDIVHDTAKIIKE